MNAASSALYAGHVVHARLSPKPHRLRYAMFQTIVDLDDLADLGGRLRLFSHNRFNLFSFHDSDHGDGREGPLRGWVEAVLSRAGIALDGGAVRLLCMPRILGHVFNPLSLYYCHRADGTLAAMLYEVNNTFGERHTYLAPAPPGSGSTIRQSCPKAFHVSPFMEMAMTYEFTVTTPGETIATTIHGRGPAGELIIVASFAGRRRPLSDGVLAGTFFRYPLLTLKVVGAIHWEALKLILKGVRLRPHPPPPPCPVTVAPPA